MPLRFVLDENLRGPLWHALVRHNALNRGLPIDVIRVGDSEELPLSISDQSILEWTERNERVLVSIDYDTMPAHLGRHLAAGRTTPGVLLLRPAQNLEEMVHLLELIAHAGVASEYENRIVFIP